MNLFNTQYQDISCKGRSKCFDTLNDDELEALEQTKLIVRYKKGEVIAKQGTSSNEILFLQKGYVKFYKEFANTRTITLIGKRCNFIGLDSLFVERITHNTVVALSDCVICSFNKKHFEKLVSSNNQFAIETIKNINEKSRKLSYNATSMSSKQMHGRMAWAIMELFEEVFDDDDDIKSQFTRKDISEYTNMSLMSVGRILREFTEDKLISLEKSKVTILNKEKLITICKNG